MRAIEAALSEIPDSNPLLIGLLKPQDSGIYDND